MPPQVPHELVEALARAVAFRRVDWPVRKRVVHDPRTRAEYRSPENYKNYILSRDGGEITQIRQEVGGRPNVSLV